MIRRPPRSTRTDTLVPYTTLFRSGRLPEAAGDPVDGGYAADVPGRRVLFDQHAAAGVAEDHPVQPGGVPDQRLPLELLRRVGRERGDQRRCDPRLPRAVPAGRVVDLPHRLGTQVVGGSGTASLNQGSTVPLTLTVIGLPRRSSALPNGSRTQPSLTQYSSTLVFSSQLKRLPMQRSSAAASWKRLRGPLDRSEARRVG